MVGAHCSTLVFVEAGDVGRVASVFSVPVSVPDSDVDVLSTTCGTGEGSLVSCSGSGATGAGSATFSLTSGSDEATGVSSAAESSSWWKGMATRRMFAGGFAFGEIMIPEA